MATQRSRLLMLIDDEPAQGRLVSALAAREGWRTLTVATGEDALEMLASPGGGEVTAILLDQWVPGDQACELIRELRAARPDVPLLMLTANTSPLLAVEAMRAGAFDRQSGLIEHCGGGTLILDRSEERRGGEECRSRWSPQR